MNREQALSALAGRKEPWDVVIIGGGATGLGAAVDAAARGYSTLLVEQHDFAKGTSSRSTKLIHGGVRYLAQGRVGLVRTALHERELLLRNAPHLVHDLSFVMPAYALWELPFYWAGLKTYDLLAGRLRRGTSKLLSRREALERVPTLVERGLCGGNLYHDCQFDDARLAMTLARTLCDLGGAAANYVQVAGLIKESGKTRGVTVVDLESKAQHDVRARVVINATGAFTDAILKLDDAGRRPLISPSRGIHLVVDRRFLPGTSAVVVPHTDDRRILFAIPWHGRTLIGTTDTPVSEAVLEPHAAEVEIDFVLNHARRYLATAPARADVLTAFAGLRPLVSDGEARRTAAVSRDHHIEVSASGLVTIAGGKWTTYRHMGEDVIDEAARVAGLASSPSRTRELRLHAWSEPCDPNDVLAVYGADAGEIRKLAATSPPLAEPLHPRLPYNKSEVVWAARHEMARTIEDVLSRRTRALFLDARASLDCARTAGELLATELGRGPDWVESQVAEFQTLARGYLCS